MRCDYKACVNQAVSGKQWCIYHDPALPQKRLDSTLPNDSYEFVDLSTIPSTTRFNQAAADLVKAVRSLPAGKGMRVMVKVFSKPTLNTVLRYGQDGGARVGLRLVGDVAYLWKMTEAELLKVQEKSDRLAKARANGARMGRKKKEV